MSYILKRAFENTKQDIIIRYSKDRQYHGWKQKDKKDKMLSRKVKIEQHESHYKPTWPQML